MISEKMIKNVEKRLYDKYLSLELLNHDYYNNCYIERDDEFKSTIKGMLNFIVNTYIRDNYNFSIYKPSPIYAVVGNYDLHIRDYYNNERVDFKLDEEFYTENYFRMISRLLNSFIRLFNICLIDEIINQYGLDKDFNRITEMSRFEYLLFITFKYHKLNKNSIKEFNKNFKIPNSITIYNNIKDKGYTLSKYKKLTLNEIYKLTMLEYKKTSKIGKTSKKHKDINKRLDILKNKT